VEWNAGNYFGDYLDNVCNIEGEEEFYYTNVVPEGNSQFTGNYLSLPWLYIGCDVGRIELAPKTWTGSIERKATVSQVYRNWKLNKHSPDSGNTSEEYALQHG